jgi:ferric-dicitrate binding protein FerR (iron transport regulator)
MSRNEHNDELDRAVAAVTEEPIDQAIIASAAARVWERLSQAGAPAGTQGAQAEERGNAPASHPAAGAGLRGCADFQSMIPAYLRGELTPARALLIEDHTRGCVPCRRALRQARLALGRDPARSDQSLGRDPALSDQSPGRDPALSDQLRFNQSPGSAPAPPTRSRLTLAPRMRWAAAAALAAALGAGVLWLAQQILPTLGGARMARVERIEGRLYQVSGESSFPIGAGDAVARGEEIRTAKDSRALVRMTDGSLIEMSGRTDLSLAAGRKGNTIRLQRGQVIVQAAKQRPRHLYVATDDCLVAVTGTIFAVNHGTKGSRVSVVEGEVRVTQAQRDTILHPGGQMTTRANLARVPVRQEIAWSGDAARYQGLLAELTAAAQAIDQQVPVPGLRGSTRLLDLVPAGTTIYVALPNIASSLGETHRLLDQRIAASDVLRQWWSDALGTSANQERFRDLIRQIGDLGKNLGDELVIAAGLGSDSSDSSDSAGSAGTSGAHSGALPVLLAEVTREAAFRATLEQEVAAINQRRQAPGTAGAPGQPLLRIVDDPSAAAAGTGSGNGADGRQVFLWVGHGLFAASPSLEQLAQVAKLRAGAANPFVASRFHDRIAQAYADGAGWLFSADLARLVAARRGSGQNAEHEKIAEQLGIYDLDNFIVNYREEQGGGETRAALTFDQPRRGISSWLAAPGPMGSLQFFSPDANLVAAFVVKSPVTLLDQLLNVSPQLAAELAKAETEHGFNLRDDLAAPLGGEVALGIDGPLLPNPSWRLVVEVYDPVRLQQTFARAVAQANQELRAAGRPQLELREERSGGRTYYSLLGAQPGQEIHYLFEGGYLLAAPAKALLDQALQQRASGTTLAGVAKLRDLLGRDGQVNVSALFYQNVAPVISSIGQALPGRPARAAPDAALGGLLKGPSLFYAYAEESRIVFAGRSELGALGRNLAMLTGFGTILGHIEQHRDASPASAQGEAH